MAIQTFMKTKDNQHAPPLAISVHGIRTDARWQKTFAEIWGGSSTKVASYDYGKYGLPLFLMPGHNDRKIDEFYGWYSTAVKSCARVKLDRYDRRPCLAAHSFGTWIVCNAMLKYDDIKLDKILLCGSILPCDFDWAKLFSRDQVALVRNERGHKDPWPAWAARVVPRTGTSGSEGFDWFVSAVEDVAYNEFGHSDFLHMRHLEEHWLPFFRKSVSPLALCHGRTIRDGQEFAKIVDYTGPVIDQEVYGQLKNYSDVEIPRTLSREWIKINPDIYTFLIDRDSGNPAGYINAMPVDENLYAGIRSGIITDNEVPASGIVSFDRRQTVKIYIMSIAVAEKHRHWDEGLWNFGYVQLISGFLDKLSDYAKRRSIRATHLLATAWTDQGVRMCKSLAMEQVGTDKFGDPIFEVELAKIPTDRKGILPAFRRLLRLYRELPG